MRVRLREGDWYYFRRYKIGKGCEPVLGVVENEYVVEVVNIEREISDEQGGAFDVRILASLRVDRSGDGVGIPATDMDRNCNTVYLEKRRILYLGRNVGDDCCKWRRFEDRDIPLVMSWGYVGDEIVQQMKRG